MSDNFTIPYYNTFKIDFRGRIYPKDPIFSPQGVRCIRPLFLLQVPTEEKVWNYYTIKNKNTYMEYISSLCGQKIDNLQDSLELLLSIREKVSDSH